MNYEEMIKTTGNGGKPMSIRLNKRAVLFAVGLTIVLLAVLLIVLAVIKSSKRGQESTYLVASENIVVIDMSTSNSAKIAIELHNPPSHENYTNGFSFSLTDLKGNVLANPPALVVGTETVGRICTVTLYGQHEGSCLVRCAHKLSDFSSSFILIVKAEKEKPGFIETSEDSILIDLSKSNCAEFGIILDDSSISDYTDGFSFSYLDLKMNELEKSPIEVTEVTADKKNGWHTVTVFAQKAGAYYIRVSHKLAHFSTDILVVVTEEKEI